MNTYVIARNVITGKVAAIATDDNRPAAVTDDEIDDVMGSLPADVEGIVVTTEATPDQMGHMLRTNYGLIGPRSN